MRSIKSNPKLPLELSDRCFSFDNISDNVPFLRCFARFFELEFETEVGDATALAGSSNLVIVLMIGVVVVVVADLGAEDGDCNDDGEEA